MESLLHRYRNITVLFVAIVAQIAGVAYQVRRDNDVPLLRIWARSRWGRIDWLVNRPVRLPGG